MSKNFNYTPTDKAKKAPLMYQLKSGEWVGIGGQIEIEANPPKENRIVPEATKEGYFEWWTNQGGLRGDQLYVKRVENKKS